MQLADGDARASEPSERAFLSPGKAFALLFGVILVLGGAIFLLRPDDLPRESVTYPAGGDAPTFELTDAEAITRFDELSDLRAQAYATTDLSLLSSIYSSDSLVRADAAKELEELQESKVRDLSLYTTRDLEVISNDPDEIVLREVVLIDPHFVDAQNRDVTTQDETVRRVIQWKLHQDAGTWLIYDALITDSRVMN